MCKYVVRCLDEFANEAQDRSQKAHCSGIFTFSLNKQTIFCCQRRGVTRTQTEHSYQKNVQGSAGALQNKHYSGVKLPRGQLTKNGPDWPVRLLKQRHMNGASVYKTVSDVSARVSRIVNGFTTEVTSGFKEHNVNDLFL